MYQFAVLSVLMAGCADPVVVVQTLSVVNISPSGGAVGVAASVSPIVLFSAHLDNSTVSNQSLWLEDADGVLVDSDLHYDRDTYGVTLDPVSMLDEESEYTLHLTTQIASAELGWLPNDVEVSFTTVGTTADTGEPNQAPVAVALPEKSTITLGSAEVLDATQSYDPEGFTLSYSWSVVGDAEGDVYDDSSSPNPLFTPTSVGEHVLSLVVSDGELESEADYINIIVEKTKSLKSGDAE